MTRDVVLTALHARLPALPGIAAALIHAPSPNPPLDTSRVAEVAAGLISAQVPEVEVTLHAAGEGVVNLVALVRGHAPGRRLVLNGHLDTYPVNEALPWTVDRWAACCRTGASTEGVLRI